MWLFKGLPATVTKTFECSFLVCAHWAMIGFLTACHGQVLNRLYRETSSFKAKFQIGTRPEDVRWENGGVGRVCTSDKTGMCGAAFKRYQLCTHSPLAALRNGQNGRWCSGWQAEVTDDWGFLCTPVKWQNLWFPANKIWRRVTHGMWNTVARQHCIRPGSEAIHWSSFPRGSSSFGASKIPARYMSKSKCCHS